MSTPPGQATRNVIFRGIAARRTAARRAGVGRASVLLLVCMLSHAPLHAGPALAQSALDDATKAAALARIDLLRNTHQVDAALAEIARLEELADAAGDSSLMNALLLRRGIQQVFLSRLPQSERILEQVCAIAEAREQAARAHVAAPLDGAVEVVDVEPGELAQPGQPLVFFADTSQLQIRVDVPARLMPGVKLGMIVPARLDVGDVNVQARVARIFPIADPERHTVTVKLDLPPGAPGGAGMYAEVMVNDITARIRDLPVVPKAALVWRGSLPGVFVLNDDDQEELRLVRTGDDVGADGVAVLSGLRAGERIVVGAGGEGGVWR